MAYEIANADGPLDQFASNQGYADLIAAAHAGKYPALRSLLDHGASEHVPEVVEDLDALIEKLAFHKALTNNERALALDEFVVR